MLQVQVELTGVVPGSVAHREDVCFCHRSMSYTAENGALGHTQLIEKIRYSF